MNNAKTLKLLVLLTANPDIIKQRMKDDPHTYSLVPESDIEDVQKEFEQVVAVAKALWPPSGGAS